MLARAGEQGELEADFGHLGGKQKPSSMDGEKQETIVMMVCSQSKVRYSEA